MNKLKLDPKSKAEKWNGRFKQAATAQDQRFKKFQSYYNFLYAVVETSPAPWRSKVFMPVLAKQVWGLAAKFLNLEPGWQARIVDSYEDLDDTQKIDLVERIQSKLAWDYNNLELDESVRDKLFEPLMDAIVTGTGMGEPSWRTTTSRHKKRTSFTPKGYADLTTEQVTEERVSYNDFDGINIFNVYTSSEAGSNLYKAPWLVITARRSLDDLKSANKQGTEIYTNLDKIRETPVKDAPGFQYQRARDRLLNQNQEFDESVSMCNLYKCYEKDSDGRIVICTYAESDAPDSEDGWILIREQVDEYWFDRYPLIKFHLKKRPYSFWGEGVFEITQTLQSAYNDVFNHYMDSLNKSDGMLLVHEDSDVVDFVVEPGGVVTWNGDVPPSPIKFPDPNPNQLQLVLSLLDQAIEGATISNYALGSSGSSLDKTRGTARGIIALQEAAGNLVSFLKDNFSSSVLMLGRMYLSNNRQFLDTPTQFPMKNAQAQVTPKELQSTFMLTLDPATMVPATEEEKRNNWAAYSQQLIGAVAAANAQADKYQTPPLLIDFDKFVKQLSEKFGYYNVDKIMMPPDVVKATQTEMVHQMMTHIMQANQDQANTAQDASKSPSESINYKDAPEDIKRQMEHQAGLQPSTGISPAGSDQLAKHTAAIKQLVTNPAGPAEISQQPTGMPL